MRHFLVKLGEHLHRVYLDPQQVLLRSIHIVRYLFHRGNLICRRLFLSLPVNFIRGWVKHLGDVVILVSGVGLLK